MNLFAVSSTSSRARDVFVSACSPLQARPAVDGCRIDVVALANKVCSVCAHVSNITPHMLHERVCVAARLRPKCLRKRLCARAKLQLIGAYVLIRPCQEVYATSICT